LDPDGFTTRGGCYVQEDHFADGLNYLLENNRWLELGEKGYSYVRQVHDTEVVLRQTMNEYERLLN